MINPGLQTQIRLAETIVVSTGQDAGIGRNPVEQSIVDGTNVSNIDIGATYDIAEERGYD